MDYNVIREARLRWPFVPFRVRMVDGREFYITFPTHVAVTERIVILRDSKGVPVIVRPNEIESLQYDAPSEKAG